MKKILPHPKISLLLVIIWMVLSGPYWGSLAFACFLALIIPLFTAQFWPDAPPITNKCALIEFIAIVLYDIIKSNIIVALIVLFTPRAKLCPAWVSVPLDITLPEAITMLAGTITMTPGTLTADIAADGRALLVHCLHAPDPSAVRDDIKTRYEARLKRIFG